MARYRFQAATCAIAVSIIVGSASAQDGPVRGIVEVADGLYRAQNNQHFTVFLVTDDGIILSDPINREFSTWLRGELDSRFDVPVRYVVYSHHHWDHASGGDVFADTAEFVGHESITRALSLPSDAALPADAANSDRNGNGLIERSEAAGDFANMFANYDWDGDGALSGREIAGGPFADVHPASRVYRDREAIELGGQVVELHHIETAHAPDMSVLRFPAQDAAFFVDIVSLNRVPFRNMPGYDLDGLLSTIRAVEAIDFSIGIGGHGDIGDKADVAEHRQYIEDLRDAVAAALAAGHSLEEMQASIELERYSGFASYEDWLPLNIAGMHRMLTSDD